jgi:branched-chain amino acid transport system substrate-binding protein
MIVTKILGETRVRSGKHKFVSTAGVIGLALLGLSACGSSSKSASPTTGVTAAGSPATTVAAAGSTYVIGAIETETSAATGQNNTDVSSTLKAWESYVNSHGGVNGHKVQVDLMEDGADPSKSVSEFQQLASDHVLAIIDGTELDSAWAADAAKDNIPVLCGEMVADDFTCSNNADFFPAGGSVLPELYGDFAAAKAAGATSVAELYCVEIAACKQSLPIYDGYTKALGLHNAAPLAASETAPSYTAQCLELSNEKVQAVFPAGPPSVKVAGDCAQQGYKPTYIEASGTWENAFLKDSVLNGAVGTVSDIPWTVDNTPATEAFHAGVGNLINTAFSPYNVITAWAAGLLFEAAATNAGDTPTGQSIISGLYALHGETLGGFSPPLTFTQGKTHTVPYYFDISVKNGQWVAPFGGTPQMVPSAISAAS